MNILLTDDSKSVHSYMTSLFEDEPSIQWIHAYCGEEALDLLNKNAYFDMIFLDWEMPGISGLETLQAIRKLGFTNPVIMVTSKNSPNDIEAALLNGASEYIMKPFDKDIIQQKLTIVGM